MSIKTLDFDTLTTANPYVIGSAPDNLTGYALYGSGTFRISGTAPNKYMRDVSGSTCLYDTTPLTSDTMSSQVVVGAAGTWGGPALINSSNGNGYYLQQDSSANRLYCFRVVAGAQGAQVGAFIANTEAQGMAIKIGRTNSSGLIRAIVNGVEVGTFTDATTSTNRAAAISQGLYLESITSEFTPAQTLTISTDLTPGASRTDACTGFPDGAATISFGGVSVPVTVASNSITWTVPALADGVTWPRIPSTGTAITLTQGGISATATGNITLPSGYDTLRVGDVDGGAPANFSGIVTDDPKFLGYHLTLTTSDTWYNPTLNGLKVYRNGDVESNEFLVDGVTLALPRTDVHFHQDASGLLTLHNVTMTAASIVVDAEITSVGTVHIGGITPVTVANFTDTINAGALDGVALTSASDTSITVASLVDGANVPRPGARELELTDGSETAAVDVVVNPPLGWSSYAITGDFVEAINGVGADYLPGSWTVTDFILSPNAPSTGKTTAVNDAGVVTNNVGTQELFLVDAATGLATAFDIVTTAGAGEIGTGSSTEPTMQVIKMESLSMVGL